MVVVVPVPGPVDLAGSLDVYRRSGDDLLDRWDGRVWLRAVAVGGAMVGPAVTVGDRCRLGPRSRLVRNVVLAEDVTVGDGSILGGDPPVLWSVDDGRVLWRPHSHEQPVASIGDEDFEVLENWASLWPSWLPTLNRSWPK